MDEPHVPSSRGQDGPQGRTPAIFVTDASAEASRIADTLKAAKYTVFEVPLDVLVTRAQSQRPHVVIVDADAQGALEEIVRLRKMPGSGAIDFVYLGSGTGAIRTVEDAVSHEASAFFVRPVDPEGLIRRIEALTGGPVSNAPARASQPPPALSGRPLSSRPPKGSSLPPDRGSNPPIALPSPGLRSPGPPLPMSSPSLVDLVDPPRSLATFGTVSSELQALLAEAEARAEAESGPEAPIPSPEEELESVLPADVLASLDEPIDGDEDDDQAADAPRTGAGDREPTGAHARSTTTGGSRHTTASGRPATGQTHERRVTSDVPAKTTDAGPDPSYRRTPERTPVRVPSAPPPVEMPPARDWVARPVAIEVRPEPPRGEPAKRHEGIVLGQGDARRFVADAIANRKSGALRFEHDGIVRRLVVRDGDLVTAGSEREGESLVQFLGASGELPRDEADRLADKVPTEGRHAGAALVAHGWLRQDQLWAALRAHAEWIAAAVLRLESGTAELETEPPGRLRSEPSVFGASTGAEIFVELMRRAVPPDEAILALGGEGSRVGDGPRQALLGECALPPHEMDLVGRSRGARLGDLLARSADAELATVLYALSLLGIVEVAPSVEAARPREAPRPSAPSPVDVDVAVLDEEAVRSRVRARLDLVTEGDYFAVLGVPRDATGYEVRRAFVELRKTFEPSRILTPRLADLAGDVRKIVVVLEEAYDILRDNARRERYRRAIEARPE